MPPFASTGWKAWKLEAVWMEERMAAHINFGLVAVRLPEPHIPLIHSFHLVAIAQLPLR